MAKPDFRLLSAADEVAYQSPSHKFGDKYFE